MQSLVNRAEQVTILGMTLLSMGLAPWAGAAGQENNEALAEEDPPAVVVIPRGPDEVAARVEESFQTKDATFDWESFDQFLGGWKTWKARQAEENKLRIGADYQVVSLWADNDFGEYDSSVGGIFRAFSSWDMWNRDDETRKGTLDVKIESRHAIGSDVPPEALAFSFGFLGSSAPDWSDLGWGVTNLAVRQRLDAGRVPIELSVGYMSAYALFDVNHLSDNLSTFQHNTLVLPPTVAYPNPGTFGVTGYVGIPDSGFYALGMVLDANGQYDSLSLSTLDEGEYFSALEFGWTDQDVAGGSYVFNNLHVGIWDSDGRGQGAQLTGTYTWSDSRVSAFGRLGRASEGSSTIYRKYAAAGIAKGVLKDSLVGLGFSWGEPHGTNASQTVTEAFYRWQLSQSLAVTPSIQFLNKPALNSVDSSITVFSLRMRLTL